MTNLKPTVQRLSSNIRQRGTALFLILATILSGILIWFSSGEAKEYEVVVITPEDATEQTE